MNNTANIQYDLIVSYSMVNHPILLSHDDFEALPELDRIIINLQFIPQRQSIPDT